MNEKQKRLMVSDLFVDIYKNFNVCDQIERMNQLSEKELYLILTFSLDKFSMKDEVVKNNLRPFKDKIMEIFDVQDGKETNNSTLLELIKESDFKYIETDYIYDSQDNAMPAPKTQSEVRDARIEKLINESGDIIE